MAADLCLNHAAEDVVFGRGCSVELEGVMNSACSPMALVAAISRLARSE